MYRVALTCFAILFSTASFGTPVGWGDTKMRSVTEEVEGCDDILHISTVNEEDLIKALKHIKQCVRPDAKLDVLVSGPGGPVVYAQAFFDNMRTTGLSKHVRFIAFGIVASATNLVWLAAEERVVMPSSLFILHEVRINITEEDPELVLNIKSIHVQATVDSVKLAAGARAAHMWESCFNDKNVGYAFTGAEAVKNGWATELWTYRK